jgi:sec-independent protein translocase protein TatA
MHRPHTHAAATKYHKHRVVAGAEVKNMGGLSIWHWLIVLMVVLLLFGTGKVSTLMGDFAKGIKAFKKNMAEDNDVSMEATERPAGSIAAPNAPVSPAAATVPPRETTAANHG